MHRIPTSALVLLACCGCAAAQDFMSLAQHAVDLQQAGQFQEAAATYRELLRLDPSQVATHVNLGIVLVKLGEYDAAIAEYKEAEKLLPGDGRIETNLALAYEKSGRLEQAYAELDRLHAGRPDDDNITLLAADCAGQLGNDARVIELLQPIEGRRPEDPGLAYMLGMALLHQHREAEGQPYLDRIAAGGDSAQARFLIATRAYEKGDYPSAVQAFARTAELDPNLPGLQSLYGEALLNTGDPDGALRAFRKQLSTAPHDFAANLHAAEILNARHEYSEALPLAQQAQTLRPDDGVSSLALAECLWGQHQFMAAHPFADSAVKRFPDSFEAHRLLGVIEEGLGHRTEAWEQRKIAEALRNEQAPRPHVSDAAPPFQLQRVDGSGSVSLDQYRGKTPVTLVFGSYTCPNFREAAAPLRSLQQRYGSRIPFLLIYIREAHSSADWQSTRNTQTLSPANTMDEKHEHARYCSRELHLTFPAVVDTLDDQVAEAYHAWPSRAIVVGKDGRVEYASGLSELDFHADEMEAVLRRLALEHSR